jgi:hypothetical protein
MNPPGPPRPPRPGRGGKDGFLPKGPIGSKRAPSGTEPLWEEVSVC